MKERILDLHNHDLKNIEICKILNVTPSVVAGVIWRHKNPGMYKKNVKASEVKHRPPYGAKSSNG